MARYRVTVDTGGTFSDFVYLDEDDRRDHRSPRYRRRPTIRRARSSPASRRCSPVASRRRHRLFLPRHHGRHQCAARRQGRRDRPAGDGRISRHLSSGRAGAALRPRDLRRHVRQARPAGAGAPHRRGDGARGFSRQGAAPARRGGAARHRARAQGAKASSSIAVCLLFSFLHPEHETRVREIVREEMPACSVSLSCEVLPQIREYYRLSTTVINAYLQPILARYVAQSGPPARRRRHHDAAEIHHAVERRHGDVRRGRAARRDHRAVGAGRRRHRRRARLPHQRTSATSSPSTWAARPATSR